jgi:hypothetical protein
MTWIYIPTTSSTVSADTGDSASDSDSPSRTPTSKRSAISSGTNIAKSSSSSGSATTRPLSIPLPSGTTSKVSTADPGVERWIFSLLASRASLTQTLDSARVPMMIATSGPTPSESLGKWHQGSESCWRTCQASLWEVMDGHHMGAPWSDSWPKSGMTRNGELYPLPMLERLISATGGGSWPTPTTEDAGRNGSAEDWRKYEKEGQTSGARLRNAAKMWPTLEPRTSETGGGSLPVRWNTPNTMDSLSAKSQQALDHEHETARPGRSNPNNLRDQVAVSEGQTLWPTPVEDGDRRTNYAQGGTSLGFAARMFPTPRAGKTTDEDEESWLARHNDGKVATPPLALAARLWATPRVDDSKNNGSPSQQERHGPALNVQVMLPTPNASDAYNANVKDNHDVKRGYLRGVVQQMLPTPSSGGDSGGPHGIRGGSWAKEKLVETFGEEDAVAMSGGSLSPDWTSWLMGLPIGWTSLEPLPKEDYDQWLQMQCDGTWWAQWWGPWWFDCPSIATGIKDRVNRLKCLGNGIVPASLSLFLRGTQ